MTAMDYRVRRNPATLESTGFMEIVGGRYKGSNWQEAGLFVWEDAFWAAEGPLLRHHAGYDHLAPNDIPKEAGIRVIADWAAGARAIRGGDWDAAAEALNVSAFTWLDGEREIQANPEPIAAMLEQLADRCTRFFDEHDWIAILGV